MDMSGKDVPYSDRSREAFAYTLFSGLLSGSGCVVSGWFFGVAVFYPDPHWWRFVVFAVVNLVVGVLSAVMFALWYRRFRRHRNTDIVCRRLEEAKRGVIVAGMEYLAAWAEITGDTRKSLEGGHE
jgi:hypothetical protein